MEVVDAVNEGHPAICGVNSGVVGVNGVLIEV